MALPNSPSAAFPSIVGSPMGSVNSNSAGGSVVLSGSMNWEPVRKRLLGPDLKDALSAATELREGIEIVHTVEFPLMLSALLPAFSTILAHRTCPSPDTSTVEHKLRNVVLEIISRMPSNEILRPHAPHLVAVALDILNRDYEENALLASRVVFDLYKVYRSLPQDYVQPYLDFVQNSYRALPSSVQRNFLFTALAVGLTSDPQAKSGSAAGESNTAKKRQSGSSTPPKVTAPKPAMATSPAPASATAPATTPAKPIAANTPPGQTMTSPSMAKIPSSPVARLSPKSNSSFRVLTECPLVVMLMFQLYPKFLRSNIPGLINVMMEALALRAPAIQSITQGSKGLDANAKRLYFSRCRELVAAQAKTLSFLTYLLRGFSSDLKPYEDRLASNVVALMSTCPREFISTRKELLVATRHLLNSEFRNGFFRHVDALLDERVLMGSHHRYSEQTLLRPLGYTTLSDLVHHVRSKLNLNQISRVVAIFSRVLHDSSTTLPMSAQYTAVRTLLSVVDIVFHNKDRNPQIGRDILVRILKTLVDKLSALHTCREQAIKNTEVKRKNKDEEIISAGASLIAQLELPLGCDPKESLRDLKSMIRAIIVGHKTLIWYINNYRAQREKEKIETVSPMPGSNEEVSSAMLKITHTEHALIDRYIELSFPCMKWLKEEDCAQKPKSSINESAVVDQYRDVLTYFAAAFTVLDGHDLRRTLGLRLDLIVDAIADEPAAIVVPRHLLAANQTTSFEFCSLLLNFLVERMDDLAIGNCRGIKFVPPAPSCDSNEVERLKTLSEEEPPGDEWAKKRSAAHLQLFERVLKSLSTFPDNERALRPHLREIVSACLRASMEKTEFKTDNYCMLLRYVFRSISAGKFEESYRELLPLIPTVLNGLFRVFRATDNKFLHHTIIELLLTIPARLSSLLPHMNLLLRVIISALESHSGDLVNLGLRTLEFWVDNLNPEFLFPELSKFTELYVRLMKSLSTHLRPAPYPYGLLTLRLLGKLGGKNRRVLREPMDVQDPGTFKEFAVQAALECRWLESQTTAEEKVTPERTNQELATAMDVDVARGVDDVVFSLPIPIERCLEILKRLAVLPKPSKAKDVVVPNSEGHEHLLWKDGNNLRKVPIEDTDLLPYCVDVVNQTQASQVESALSVLRIALTQMAIGESPNLGAIDITDKAGAGEPEEKKEEPVVDIQSTYASSLACNKELELVGFGLMLGCAIESVREKSLVFVKGFLTNIFLIVASHQRCFLRIDANGSPLIPQEDESMDGSEEVKNIESGSGMFEEGLGSLKPFGYFELIGPLRYTTNPLTVNRSLAELLSQPSRETIDVGVDLLRHVLTLPQKLDMAAQENRENYPGGHNQASLIFFENLLDALCEKCVASTWNRRQGLHEGICLVLRTLGAEWSRKYEIEVMHVALFSLKSVPKELSMAAVKAFEFVVQVCTALYGKAKIPANGITMDVLVQKVSSKESKVASSPKNDEDKATEPRAADENDSTLLPSNESGLHAPRDDVLQVLISEIASTKQILRLASRYILKHYVIDVFTREKCHDIFKGQLPLIKRVLFSRSLRLLPLPEQVGAVEALGFIVDQLPDLIPLNDQHLLAFLSELLKMSSVADGEMTDANLVGSVVDKNGFAVPALESSTADGNDSKSKHRESPSSALFLRRDAILTVDESKVHIAQELPNGIQLRVSSIHLVRAVIRGHANPFFDAESSTPVGNIRPHVISLLFRSLVSFPLKAVIAAHDALRDVLALSVVADGGKSKSRLRKELLQTCIRPVLLNLRDYTRLSVHLLRGLSRLLSLLASWFNKTLGEKLLDHLQKWTDPNRMRAQKIWPEGEEPDVAAAIIDLFVLLPHASHFVEPLVKTTIKLEACLPVFKSRHAVSPYRKPLASYLNKHCQYTVSFFLQRLKTPLYSSIFQDLVKLPESKPLRDYLSGRQCSVSLLNVCFERPLAIIRSEKTASTSSNPGTSPPIKPTLPLNTNELFGLHGIHPFTASPTQKELALKQDVDSKKKKLQILQQELVKTKDAVQAKAASSSASNTTTPLEVEEAKRKHKMAKIAYDRVVKEFNDVNQKYAGEVAKSKATQKRPTQEKSGTRPMSIEALELQLQGFRLVSTLISKDKSYLKDHNDVLRAFRWLWRSKGRYLRLQHDDGVSPRYHDESNMLATILLDYSKNFPSDVDLLFELIRIFLQSSPYDFSFVRSYLSEAVAKLSVDQEKQIIHRFFALLAGESTEEIKTLSIQLVVYPMLHTSFNEKQAKVGSKAKITSAESTKEVPKYQEYDFIDMTAPKQFVREVLFSEGKQIHCGGRLKVELLKMCNLLLEFVPAYMEELGKDVVKFCWSLLKCEDASCKSWAYLVLCRHIAVMETSPKFILQVYGALVRLHQQEGKEIVRAALDLLVPSMQRKLDDQNMKKAIEYTNRVMFEEVNSIPQLAHIWHTIVNHADIFFSNRNQFVRYMINSLTRLGLPPNSPQENRTLSISVVELILHWNAEEKTIRSQSGSEDEAKKKAETKLTAEAGSSHADKKQKTSTGVGSISRLTSEEPSPVLDQTMVDTMINFLVRLKILLADPKLDIGLWNIESKVAPLLVTIASEWKQCHIRAVYLEKVVSMCKDYNAKSHDVISKPTVAHNKPAPKSKPGIKSKSGVSQSSATAGKPDEARQLSASLLSACLDIFITLAKVAPSNSFLTDNSSQLNEILTSSFRFVRKSETMELRNKLKSFVVLVLLFDRKNSRMDGNVSQRINVLLEELLVESELQYQKAPTLPPSSPEQARQVPSRPKPSPQDEERNDESVALFALEVIKEVNSMKPSYFKSFTRSLLSLLSTIVKKHTAVASTKQKQGGVSYVPQAGTCTIRQMFHTPTTGILAEVYKAENPQLGSAATRSLQPKELYPSKEVDEFDQSLRSAVIILGILGNTDLPYTFSDGRKVLFQSLGMIFDSSNSVKLLMATVRVVGQWLTDETGRPLTSKERKNFLWKMASFDYNGLSDVVAQPLVDTVSQYVIELTKHVQLEKKISSDLNEDSLMDVDPPGPNARHHNDIVVGRSLMACLLTANHRSREKVLSLFVSQANCNMQATPFELLWQLFHSDFEGLGGRDWVVLFVDLLLSSVDSSTSQKGGKPVWPWTKLRLLCPRGDGDKWKTLAGHQSEYSTFCETLQNSKDDILSGGGELRTSLRRLAHGDTSLCRLLFKRLFPAAWASVNDDGVRLKLVPSMESLLSRTFHSQFLKTGCTDSSEQRPSNVIKSFLIGFAELKPLPLLDIDLLVSLAGSYNCWYEVLSILENQFLVVSSSELSSTGKTLRDKMLLAMRHLYRELGESNIWTSLALSSCTSQQTHRAASLAIHGKIDEALDTYTSLIELVESESIPSPTDFEMEFIEEKWVELNREQCQTIIVSEYAQASKKSGLMLECAWKQRDWDQVRVLCASSSLIAAVEAGEPSVKMCETLLAVADGKLADVENLHAQTAQLCLYKWQLLPDLSSASLSHASLLQYFHRLVEIRESGQIMVETSNHSNGKTLPDLKNLLNAWRHRLPNDYEDLATWDEVFTWRSHMFSAITSNFSWSEPTTLATLHDRPWTAIRMSITARKHGLQQTALLLLNKLSDNRAMDVSDAYLKLREQILAYNNPDNDLERTGGLNLINTTNLTYFDATQKSELFRLKAMFLSSIRRTSKSNQAYCHSVQICPTHAKAWISWGGLCSSLGTLTEKQTEQLAAKSGNTPESTKDARAASTKKVAQYLAQSMGCYLEAVQIDSASDKARIHLPKCLWILTKDGSSPGVLCQTIENRGTKLPPWVWLPWIPQLLTGLCRVEGRAIKTILARVVKAYPQAVYYSLRAFYLERRDVERSKGISSTSSQHMPSVAYAEEMMSTLRRSHASLWSSLEAILEELIVKFRPSYEEELLATISALLERAESHAEKQSLPDKARLEDEDAMVASWSKTLSRIAAKFFRVADASSGPSRRDERVKKTADFKRKYKADFEGDFKVSAAEVQGTMSPSDSKPQFRLAEYITRLQKWKRKLEAQVSCTPTSLPLIESSHSLAMFAGDMPDLWPGACDTKYLSAGVDRNQEAEDDTSRNQPTTSSSAAIARKAALNASIAAANAAAREGVGGEYGGGAASIEIPGQYCPNSSTTADIKPCPELHSKLYQFEPFVEVLRRNDQLVRRVGMIGSDGRTYRFLLQFAIPYWTRTDERTAQTNFVIDKFLRQNVVCARNHLSVQPSAAIPVAQRLRMTLDKESRVALDDVFRISCNAHEKKPEAIPELFLKEVVNKLKIQTTNETPQEEREKLEKAIRLEVFRDICSSKVDNGILLSHMQQVLDGPERLFHFRRAFAGQLASNSLLQYVFSVAERTPQRFVILQSRGQVLSPDFRVTYSSQGFIEGQPVPFRMTPNIETLIGKAYLDGRFIRAFAMVAGAIREHREEFDPILRLLMRDDILAWYSKSLAKTDSKTQELERQLVERVSKNVSMLHSRFSECAPTSTKASKEGPIDSKVKELYEVATNMENLSMMPTNYHAWL